MLPPLLHRRAGRAALVVAVAVAAVPTGAEPGRQTVVPSTPAGRKLTDWLGALNSGEGARLRKFYADQLPPDAKPDPNLIDRPAEGDLGFFGDTRGLDVRRVAATSPTELQAFAQARLTGAWIRIDLAVNPQPPYGLRGFGVRAVDAPEELMASKPLSQKEIQRNLDTLLRRLAGADAFSGVVLVAKDGKPFYVKSLGLANRGWNVPNRRDTRFNLGSVNKMFTAVAIAQLVEQGKLAYGDAIGRVLPDYPNRAVAEKVTVDQLLTHTSGLGDIFNDRFFAASRTRFRTVRDYFPLFVDDPLQFEPGSRFEYSNAGYQVLGAIVEKASGQDYFDYVREHIARPAGMNDTDCYDVDADPPRLATGYTREGAAKGEPRRSNAFLHVVRGGPSGGGYSTVEDLLRFGQALQNHVLVNEASLEALWRDRVDFRPAPGSRYGYGFILKRYGGTRIVGHAGGFPGISSQLDLYPDLGYTVAVMSNVDQGAVVVASRLREWIVQGRGHRTGN
jgi:CubicO group peptidase (beta-lactamase class C family)